MTFLLLLPLLFAGVPGDEVTVEASPLKRNQLPDGFPFQAQQVGFAVIQVQLTNNSSQPWTFDPQSVQLLSPKKKKLKRAAPSEIAPKLMKFYAGTRRGIHGETFGGPRPTPSEMRGAPTLDPNTPPGTVSADTGPQLRALLESFELAGATLQPGQSLQGLLYFKSKHSGSRLYGGVFKLGEGISAPLGK